MGDPEAPRLASAGASEGRGAGGRGVRCAVAGHQGGLSGCDDEEGYVGPGLGGLARPAGPQPDISGALPSFKACGSLFLKPREDCGLCHLVCC